MTNERLSALDASFLHLERPGTPMHISSLSLYEGPVPPTEELHELLSARLHLVPRFRQRVVEVPFGQHRPVWVDDPDFDLDTHLQHIALPAPGTDEQLMDLTARLLAMPLDRARPLWEMWLIDGLTDGRFAILAKTHHALFDGIAGADLHTVLLDPSPTPLDVAHEPWEPGPQPTRPGLLFQGLRERGGDAIGIASAFARATRDPLGSARRGFEVARGAASYARSAMRLAPPSPLNAPTGTRRRFRIVRASLDDFRRASKAFGVSINDVVLATVSGALRTWLIERYVVPTELRAMVPVSIRTPADRGTPGNKVVMFTVPLPVGEDDPVRRVDLVHATMQREKESGQVRAEEFVTQLAAFAPPQVVAELTRVQSVARWFNLLVTNIPGPQFPLYLRGRRLLELFPQAPLAANQALSIAVLSYDGNMGFGLLADHEAVPDIDVLAGALEASINDVVGVEVLRRSLSAARVRADQLVTMPAAVPT